MTHVRDLIERSLEDEITASEQDHLDAHLRGCAHCRGLHAEFRRNDALLSQRQPLPEVPPRRRSRSHPLGLAWPAALTATMLVTALVVGAQLNTWRAASGPAAASSSPAPVVASDPNVGVCAAARAAVRGMTFVVERVDRIDSKRVSLKDFVEAGGFVGSQFQAAAPTNLFLCVVAVSGQIQQPFGLIRTPPHPWGLYVYVAGSNDAVSSTLGNNGNWPPIYDSLREPTPAPYPAYVTEVVAPDTIRVAFESANVSEEFGEPLLRGDKFTQIVPSVATIQATGVKPGDLVGVFFEREGRDPASGAYRLSIFERRLAGARVASSVAPVCARGLPALDVTNAPPPGDEPGTGAAGPEEAFRRAFPSITTFTMYPLGSDQPTRDPTGQGPVWIIAGSDSFIALYIGPRGLNSWFAHPAKFLGCREPQTRPSPSASATPADCSSVAQAVLPPLPSMYPTRTASEVTTGLKTDPYFRHTLEDIAGVRQDSNPLRDAGVPRCAVDSLRTGQPIFVRSYPSEAGLWYVPVIFGDRQVLLVTVGRNEAGIGASGGSVGGGGGSGSAFPPMIRAKAMQVASAPSDPAVAAELVFAHAYRAPSELVAWRTVRASGSVYYLFPVYPGSGEEGLLLPESEVSVGS